MKNVTEIKKMNEEIERMENRIAVLTAKGAHHKIIEAREDELAEMYIKLDMLENGDTPSAEPVPPTPTKKAQGRPKGSKNRPKAGVGAVPKVSLPDDKPAKKAVSLKGTYRFKATGKVAKSGLSTEFQPVDGSPFAGLGALYVKLSSLDDDLDGFTVTIS